MYRAGRDLMAGPSRHVLWGVVGLAAAIACKMWIDTGFDLGQIEAEPLGPLALYGVIGAAAGVILRSFL